MYEGETKLKVEINKHEGRNFLIKILEQEGCDRDGSESKCIFALDKVGKIVNDGGTPEVDDDGGIVFYVCGNENSIGKNYTLYEKFFEPTIELLQAFGATIVGDAVCIDHDWITIHPGDPIYEGTFCKICQMRKNNERVS